MTEDQVAAVNQAEKLRKIIEDSFAGLTDHEALELFEDMLISTIHARRAKLRSQRAESIQKL